MHPAWVLQHGKGTALAARSGVIAAEVLGCRVDQEKSKFYIQEVQGEAGGDVGSLICKVRWGSDLMSFNSQSFKVIWQPPV